MTASLPSRKLADKIPGERLAPHSLPPTRRPEPLGGRPTLQSPLRLPEPSGARAERTAALLGAQDLSLAKGEDLGLEFLFWSEFSHLLATEYLRPIGFISPPPSARVLAFVYLRLPLAPLVS